MLAEAQRSQSFLRILCSDVFRFVPLIILEEFDRDLEKGGQFLRPGLADGFVVLEDFRGQALVADDGGNVFVPESTILEDGL